MHKGHYVAYHSTVADDPKALVVGLVLENKRQDRTILVHCMRAVWDSIKWKLLYLTSREEVEVETLRVT